VINIGQQQFHLPTGKPQVLRGWVGLVVPDLDALTARLAEVKPKLAGPSSPTRSRTSTSP